MLNLRACTDAEEISEKAAREGRAKIGAARNCNFAAHRKNGGKLSITTAQGRFDAQTFQCVEAVEFDGGDVTDVHRQHDVGHVVFARALPHDFA